MKKVMLVFGTRPEAIKMAPLVKEFQKYPDKFKTIVCVTGQHREMLDQVLNIFDIKPDFDLNIMKQGQDLYDVTSRVLLGMRDILRENCPDLVLVHGDTTTSTAAALASFYQKIPVGHIEAGLRTHDIYSPWPEEINRQLTSRIATFNFAPTELSRKNLLDEGVSENRIFVTGNTVIDALHMAVRIIEGNGHVRDSLMEELREFNIDEKNMASWGNKSRRLILMTGHRRENFGEGFVHLCNAVKSLATKYDNVDIVYPVHLNPNVQKPVHEILDNISNVFLIKPLDYLPFVYLMKRSTLILTDSGGVQEEAPGLGKPVLVMRDTTERPEALKAGTVKLVGTDYKKIVDETSLLLNSSEEYEKMSKAVNPYGDGKACSRIVYNISNY
ncbi:MAG: UDP-N-acetylglucosamine 2-epimerase (non-hydrolyzing) [Bacteroidales bacterium]|jgi:UDP-N-acetylglucosamine 2-epimerase (non-hydrolysing)|nr:UDP-N-acetylglucosamine 2-epimerase (non-hydrolyzing) [Bacteroidales bacterium]